MEKTRNLRIFNVAVKRYGDENFYWFNCSDSPNHIPVSFWTVNKDGITSIIASYKRILMWTRTTIVW